MIERFENGPGAVVEIETTLGWQRLPAMLLIERPGGFAFITPAYFSEQSGDRSAHTVDATLTAAGERIEFVGPVFSGWIERHDGAEFPRLREALARLAAEGVTQDDLREELRPDFP